MADSPEEILKHLRIYKIVGIILVVGTLITVAVAKIPWLDFGAPGVSAPDIVLGLTIASVKTSFVMLIFMHLNNEKPLIYKILLFTIVFAIGLFFLSYLHYLDPAVFEGMWNKPAAG